MKRLSLLFIFILSLTAYAFSISRAAMLEVEKNGMIPDSSLDFTIDHYAAIQSIPTLGALRFQDWQDLDARDSFSFDRNAGGLPSPHISDSFGRGVGALFITGAITSDHSSVLDSSTMLMLGITLVSLSGYFGRRKFKR
jgi:LPXTG-motif cell wall-anchored protein